MDRCSGWAPEWTYACDTAITHGKQQKKCYRLYTAIRHIRVVHIYDNSWILEHQSHYEWNGQSVQSIPFPLYGNLLGHACLMIIAAQQSMSYSLQQILVSSLSNSFLVFNSYTVTNDKMFTFHQILLWFHIDQLISRLKSAYYAVLYCCDSNVVKENFKNAALFLCTVYHILQHNFGGQRP